MCLWGRILHITAVIDRVLPFEDIDAALTRLRRYRAEGKVVLTLTRS
jgi:NADPH:quinone reductase-like Zn-dependent oxidoreductase